MKVIGHRGAAGYEPENTLRSVERAIQLGADIIEVDVFTLPTDEIVVIHDQRLDRTTNGQGLVTAARFDELRALDAGKGERIPTLDEVIELVAGRIPLNIEIKDPGSTQVVAELLRSYLKRGRQPSDFMVSSFNHPELLAFKQCLPTVDTVALIYSIPLDYAAFGDALQARAVAPAVDLVTREFVTDAHQRGMLLYAWVWEPVYEEDVDRLYDWGVDGLFTDFPDQTRAIIERRAAGRADTAR